MQHLYPPHFNVIDYLVQICNYNPWVFFGNEPQSLFMCLVRDMYLVCLRIENVPFR